MALAVYRPLETTLRKDFDGLSDELIAHLTGFSHRNEGVGAAPAISPGVVSDGESLLREMFNPEHVRDGIVIERAVSVDDLRSQRSGRIARSLSGNRST